MGWGDIAEGAVTGGSAGAMFGGVGAPVGIGVGALMGLLQGKAKDKKNAAINEARAVEIANAPYTGEPITGKVAEMSDWAKTAGAMGAAAAARQNFIKNNQDEEFRNKQLKTMNENALLAQPKSIMSSPNQSMYQQLLNELMQNKAIG